VPPSPSVPLLLWPPLLFAMDVLAEPLLPAELDAPVWVPPPSKVPWLLVPPLTQVPALHVSPALQVPLP
jgi:hypothetical protein